MPPRENLRMRLPGSGAGLGTAFLASRRIRGEELVIPLDTCDTLSRGLTPLLDIRAAIAYCEGIAPDIWRLSPGKYGEAVQHRSFLFRSAPLRRNGPVKGKSPRELIPPTATCRAGPATLYIKFLTD
jgi:hypothetical protein